MIDAFENNLKDSLFREDRFKYEVLNSSTQIKVEYFDPENKTKRCYLTVADNGKLPSDDECFDTYVSNYSIQYSDNPQSLIKEAYRVLNKGGIL